MKKKLRQLASGKIEIESTKPVFTPAYIDEVLLDDVSFTGKFTISSRTDEVIRGLIYVQSPSIQLKNSQFEGKECQISYEVNGHCFPENGVIASKFIIISDAGECELPCKFSQESHVKGKTSGFPNTLEELAQMAVKWPMGAALIFEMEEFVHLPFMQDGKLQALYQGLHKQKNTVQALEEFLIGSQVKEPVSYELEVESGSYLVQAPDMQQDRLISASIQGIVQEEVSLYQKNEGSAWVYVSTDSPFIVLEKSLLTLEDFTQQRAVCRFALDSSKMHSGKNFGYIIFKTAVQTLWYAVEAFTEEPAADEVYQQYQQGLILYTSLSLQLFEEERRLLEEVKLQREDTLQREEDFTQESLAEEEGTKAEEVLREAEKELTPKMTELLMEMLHAVDKIRAYAQEETKYILLEAEILAKLGRTEEAAEHIQPLKSTIQAESRPAYYGLYQYICYLIDSRSVSLSALCETLEEQVLGSPQDMDLLYLLLRLHREYRDDPQKAWNCLKAAGEGMRISPMLLAIAADCLVKQPELLERVENFECKVLNKVLQQNQMTPQLAISAAVHLGAGRKFIPNMYYLYTKLYHYYPCKELLYAVCALLIKGDCRKPEFFSWYQKGIEADVRVTRLYDYYLYALPEDYDQAFPRTLLLYYSYDHPKDIQIRNAIYHNVIQYYSQDEQIYRLYEEEIRGYVLEQLQSEKIVPECALLYRHVLEEDLIDERLALTLIPMLCTWKITCFSQNISYVICVLAGRKEEKKLQLRRGIAYIPVYEEDFILLFEDAAGIRYASALYICEQVMDCPDLLEHCEMLLPGQQVVLSRHVQQIAKKDSYTKEDITLFEQFIGDERTNSLFKRTLMNKCVEYYLEHTQEIDSDAYILQRASYLLKGQELVRLIEMFIFNGCYNEAYDLIRINGYEGIHPETLFLLCQKLVDRLDGEEEPLLVHMVGWTYQRGYFNHHSLNYLAKWYHGSSDILYQILQDCLKEEIGGERLIEELLIQKLFTGSMNMMDEVFRDYLQIGNADDLVQSAYLAVRCHSYAVGYEDLPKDIFAIVRRQLLAPGQIQKITLGQCLAVVRYLSELEVLEEEDKDLLKDLLLRLHTQDICLSYTQKAAARLGYSTHSMIETRPLSANARIFAEYWIEGEEELHREEMRHVYGGIYTKEVILFCNEQLSYRVYEEGVREAVDAGSMTGGDWLAVGSDRYALLNQMMLAENPQEFIQEYCRKEILLRERFKLL